MRFLREQRAILTTLIVTLVAGVPVIAGAQMQTNLDGQALFEATNIAPGYTGTANVEIGNLGDDARDVYVVGHNVNDPAGLAEQMHITVSAGESTPIDTAFDAFLYSKPGREYLSTIPAGATSTYQLAVHFHESATMQNTTMGFDLCFGFEGGNLQCVQTTGTGGDGVDDDSGPQTPPENITPDSAGGAGGGGFIVQAPNSDADINNDGFIDIVDYNELVAVWGQTGSAIPADINNDGVVDILDFNQLMAAWRANA